MPEAIFSRRRGDSPLIVSMPHCGVLLPGGLAERLTPEARDLPDTDWHIPRLYDFLGDFDATVITAQFSRYVIDLNRPPGGESLYPGQATTGLCPTTLFDGHPLYRDGQEPDGEEAAGRLAGYWTPYHQALAEEIARVKARHGYALLYDAHSIRSVVPRLFDGRLPDLNLGTVHGASVAAELRQRLAGQVADAGFTSAVDGRFVGGHITRHYGRPADNVHAVQMELAQARYMDEDGPPFAYAPERAAALQAVLRRVVAAMLDWRPCP